MLRWGGSVGFLDGDLKDEKGRPDAQTSTQDLRPKTELQYRNECDISCWRVANGRSQNLPSASQVAVELGFPLRTAASARRSAGGWRTRRRPSVHVVDDAVEGGDAAGPADHAQVQADRHHLGMPLALGPQRVEGVGRVLGEVARRHEAMEALVIVHVVGVEAVGNHQVLLA